MLGGQRLEHRDLCGPAQSVQRADVVGEQVVLDHAAVLGPVDLDDVVVVAAGQRGAARGFAALEIPGARGLDYRRWHAQADLAVDRAPATSELMSIVLDGDVV